MANTGFINAKDKPTDDPLYDFYNVECPDYNLRMGKKPIKMWTRGVEVDEDAVKQLYRLSNMPFIHRHIAVMADMHSGIGATIGTVLATKGAIIPAAVGVDLGCSMSYTQTNLTASNLPESLRGLREALEQAIPNGRTNNGQRGDKGGWDIDNLPFDVRQIWDTYLGPGYAKIIAKHPKASGYNCVSHLGTLGTGNHFIEVTLDENDNVGIMVHSGSRGPGNRIGAYFIERAKEEMSRYFIDQFLEDKDLAYLVEHSDLFDDYIEAVFWAQEFAKYNHEIMMKNALSTLFNFLKWPKPMVKESYVHCQHNYVARENHFNHNVLVTRKGAVRARVDDYGIIPGSMGTGSFIVKGKGNKESFCSCSHGAGRKMSRGQAKKLFDVEHHKKSMAGIEARLDADVLDETPDAYKDIGAVMKAQESLVEIIHRLRQVVNVKG